MVETEEEQDDTMLLKAESMNGMALDGFTAGYFLGGSAVDKKES